MSNPKRERHASQGQVIETKTSIENGTSLSVVLREACVCKRDAPMCFSIRSWPLRRDDSSRVLIGAGVAWRFDWRRRDVRVLNGQSACILLALAREAIDSTPASASGCLHSAATGSLQMHLLFYLIT